MHLGTWHLVPLLLALLVSGCAERVPAPATQPDTSATRQDKSRFSQQGKASFYARMHHGQRTANGETHDQNAMVAAHRSLAFGTRINDRGPFVRGRIIDLSRAAAERIGMIDQGIARVRIETLE